METEVAIVVVFAAKTRGAALVAAAAEATTPVCTAAETAGSDLVTGRAKVAGAVVGAMGSTAAARASPSFAVESATIAVANDDDDDDDSAGNFPAVASLLLLLVVSAKLLMSLEEGSTTSGVSSCTTLPLSPKISSNIFAERLATEGLLLAWLTRCLISSMAD